MADPKDSRDAPGDADTSPRAAGVRTERAIFGSGEVVAGRFRVVRFLAAGGMGEVYEALDLELNERVALKALRPHLIEDERATERFRREVQLARKITHPNVCRIFDVFRHTLPPLAGRALPDVTFLTMELLEGETLAQRVARGPLTTAEARPVVDQMAAALAAAHEAGIVHRDFKSANVVLVPRGDGSGLRAVVTDFGLARGIAAVRAASITESGALLGTPAYMAPEQIAGGEIGPGADVYALGVVMYEMVTGGRPFEGDTPISTALLRLHATPPSPRARVPDLDPRWETAILLCLERDPRDRLASPRDVVSVLSGEAVAPRGRDRRRRVKGLAWGVPAAALLSLATTAWLMRSSHPAAPLPPGGQASPAIKARRAVAVLGFRNLSGRADAAWLSTAFSEMLTAELAAGERLRTIPGEKVARMKVELSLPDADNLGADTLARVRTNLGPDLVLLGSYLALPRAASGRIRLDLRLQDTVAGETIAAITESGTEAELLDLVSRAGTRLRQALGVGDVLAADAAAARASFPSTPAAARSYAEGLQRLRLFDALAARKLLEEAITADPAFPLAHSALAEAWAALGYDDKAREAAKQAFERSQRLSREERLFVEGRYREATRELDKSVEIYRVLFGFFPDDLDYGLHLVAAQTAGGKASEARGTIDALRRLPAPANDDPRIDVAEAELLFRRDNRKAQSAASLAATKSSARGARLLAARAWLVEAGASEDLGERLRAKAAAERSRQAYAEVGDRGGVARALLKMSTALRYEGRLPESRKAAEDALLLSQAIGDRRSIAESLNRIGGVLIRWGRLREAEARFRESLAMWQAMGYQNWEATAINNIGDTLWRQGRLSEATRMFEESRSLSRVVSLTAGVAFSSRNLGFVLFDQGLLSQAKARHQEAVSVARQAGFRSIEAHALYGLGEVSLAEGQATDASAAFEQALAIQSEIGEEERAASVRLALGILSLEQGRPASAEDSVRRAIRTFEAIKAQDDEAAAYAVLARALLGQGKLGEAQRAVDHALALSSKSEDPHIRLAVAATMARIVAANNEPNQVISSLEATVAEATKFGIVPLQLEARLALGEMELKARRAASGRSHLEALERDATERGFLLIAGKVRRALDAKRQP